MCVLQLGIDILLKSQIIFIVKIIISSQYLFVWYCNNSLRTPFRYQRLGALFLVYFLKRYFQRVRGKQLLVGQNFMNMYFVFFLNFCKTHFFFYFLTHKHKKQTYCYVISTQQMHLFLQKWGGLCIKRQIS